VDTASWGRLLKKGKKGRDNLATQRRIARKKKSDEGKETETKPTRKMRQGALVPPVVTNTQMETTINHRKGEGTIRRGFQITTDSGDRISATTKRGTSAKKPVNIGGGRSGLGA